MPEDPVKQYLREIGRKGGKARMASMTALERKEGDGQEAQDGTITRRIHNPNPVLFMAAATARRLFSENWPLTEAGIKCTLIQVPDVKRKVRLRYYVEAEV